MSGDGVDVKLARLDEKVEHMIRAQEDSNRDRRDAHKLLQTRLDEIDQRVQRVEIAVMTSDTSVKLLLKLTVVLVSAFGMIYSVIHALGLTLIIR